VSPELVHSEGCFADLWEASTLAGCSALSLGLGAAATCLGCRPALKRILIEPEAPVRQYGRGALLRDRELVSVSGCKLLEPGNWALRWFEGDDVRHKRLLLWPSRRDKSRFVRVTPDEHVYEEVFLEADATNHAIGSFGLGRRTEVPWAVTQEIYEGIFSEATAKEDLQG